MRKLIIVIIVLVGFTVGINISREPKGFHTYQEVVKKLVDDAPLASYRDSFYGYTIQYPEFFAQEISSRGFVRLGYWDNERFVLECSVLPEPDITPTEIKMNHMAQLLHAEEQELLKDSFILSGPLYEDGERVEGYRYHAKYVRNCKLWFSYTLFYPESCRESLSRLLHQIEKWEV